MNSTTESTGRKLGAAAVVVALVLGAATVVAAQAGPTSDCSGDVTVEFGSQFFGLQDNGNRLMSTSPSSIVFAMSTPLAPGTYTLDGVAYDGYEQRASTPPQLQEQWFAELLGADGAVLATSGITGELEDEVVEATWSGSLGEVTLAAPATAVRVIHAAPGSSSVNSVRPVCLGATGSAEAIDQTPTESPDTDPDSPDPEPDEPATELVVTDVDVDPDASPSSVIVDFESNSTSASVVSVTCSVLSESASGININLELPEVPAGDSCVVEYPTDLDCAIAVEPESVVASSELGIQNIDVPATGDVRIFVGISCVESQAAGAVDETTTTTVAPAAVVTTTTAAPAATTTTTTTTTIAPSVAGAVETAPAAAAQPGNPAFTG